MVRSFVRRVAAAVGGVALGAGLAVPGGPRVAAAGDDGTAAAVVAFLEAEPGEAQDAAAAALVARRPAFDAVAAALAAGRPARAPAATGWLRRAQRCSDGVERPYLLYVPPGVAAGTRLRVVFDLHGGVSRPAVLTAEELDEMRSLRGDHAEAHGYVLVLPTGQAKAEWWTEVGASNVLGILAELKRTLDVDEDRVFVTGFSDGGSGSFWLALTHPTPFAGFVPLNGHLGVAGAGGLEVCLRTLRNRPVYAVNTDLDSLYPSAAVRPVADALKALGAPFTWREVLGFAHDPSYLATERAPIWAWEQGVVREPHPARLTWEGTPGAPSRVAWLGRVDVAATGVGPARPDVNPELPPGRVRLGIVVDPGFAGPGVRVKEVADGSAAAAAGLAAGDVLVRVGTADTPDPRALRRALGAVVAGTSVPVAVRRGDGTLQKDVRFPEAKPEPAFRRSGAPRGVLEAERAGNTFTVTCRDVAAFELWLGVGAVDLAAPVVVTVNGAEVHRGVVAPDLGFLLERAAADDDRRMLYAARLRVKVPAGAPTAR